MTSTSVQTAARESDVLRDVRWGLRRPQKKLPSRYFYDHRGSLLFEDITRLPEYYLTNAERRLLREWMPALVREHRPVTLVELGAGSGEKTRIILRAMREADRGLVYVPVDVSAEFLDATATALRQELPWLEVNPVVGDFTADHAVSAGRVGAGPRLFAFLGSTIGNLDTPAATALLERVRGLMSADDRFLLGADLRTKPIERIERAYNDSAGVTAEFNLNILRALNEALGADFDLARYEHRAFWSWAHRRIEMHLVARECHRVSVPGLGSVAFAEGESIRTEICGKYDRHDLETMLSAAGLRLETWRVDPHDQYAILIAAPQAKTASRVGVEQRSSSRPAPIATVEVRPFVEQLRREAFSSARDVSAPGLIGAEVEFIPVESASRRVAPIEGGPVATLPLIRLLAAKRGWVERFSAKAGVPEWGTPAGGRLTYEPGGQIEYAAPPNESVSGLVDDLRALALDLTETFAGRGVELVSAGLDPVNRIEDVPLSLTADRYVRMDRHFGRIGPHGARMMRQTASIQICVDLGPEPFRRYVLLNALTPYLVAMFANSSVYEGATTGYRSTRRFIWQELDPGRTGIVCDPHDAAAGYARFAMHAPAILLGSTDAPCVPFWQHVRDGGAGMDEWRSHLSTLFPEVRPRGYFEVRSIDALDPAWYAAPLALVAGLLLDRDAAAMAEQVAGAADPALLARAARVGLTDPTLAAAARELVRIALDGCASLGGRVAGRDVLCLADYARRFTDRGRSPADDAIDERQRGAGGPPAHRATFAANHHPD